jgi:type IV secretory pathway TrbD component
VTQSPGEYKPNRRDVLRPVEYVGGSAIAAVFTGVVTLVVTRDVTLALIATGGVFIIVLVALALFSMAVKPDASESAELHEHDAPRADGSPDEPGAGGNGDDHGGDVPEGPAAPPRAH